MRFLLCLPSKVAVRSNWLIRGRRSRWRVLTCYGKTAISFDSRRRLRAWILVKQSAAIISVLDERACVKKAATWRAAWSASSATQYVRKEFTAIAWEETWQARQEPAEWVWRGRWRSSGWSRSAERWEWISIAIAIAEAIPTGSVRRIVWRIEWRFGSPLAARRCGRSGGTSSCCCRRSPTASRCCGRQVPNVGICSRIRLRGRRTFALGQNAKNDNKIL